MNRQSLSFGDAIGDRYRITDVLGQGGMATVYKAHQAGLERDVAVKVMHHFLSSQGGFLQRFKMEAQNLATLRHPNIVQVFDFAVDAGLCYMVMEFLPGNTVRQRLHALEQANELMPIDEVVRVGIDLGEALGYAHQRGLIHRDIKPGNVIYGADDHVVLTDFGISRLMTSELHLTATQAMVGTPNYMAPEFGKGQRGDTRADIYSLGVLLYQLATGRLPFLADTPIAVVRLHIEEPPEQLRTIRGEIPEGLEKTILRALAKHPEERYQTVAEMVAQLRHLPDAAQQSLPPSLQQKRSQPAGPRSDNDTAIIHDAIIPPPNNLPVQLTSFIGREAEKDAILELLRQEHVRLVTIIGPGGVGKTRLSQQVAAKLLFEYPDGVRFIPLEAIREPAQVAETIAQYLGVKSSSEGILTDYIGDLLATKKMLLLLDNFEQVLEAAQTVEAILQAAPYCKVLVTSRAVLRIYGEQEYPLEPLLLDQKSRSDSPAITLFAERARAVKPNFVIDDHNQQTVAQICSRLDGLPLAIELAAARVKMLSPAAILKRLGPDVETGSLQLLRGSAQNLPSRQQTLRGAIDWSYNLLDPQERLLLNRLAVFVGTRPFEALQPVINGDGKLTIDLLDGVASLVDKSLLSQHEGLDGEPNFLMLRTIHAYAREQLHQEPEHLEIYHQHAAYYLSLSEAGGAALQGPEQRKWLDILSWSHDNLRAGLDWAESQDDKELVARFCQALWRFWDAQGHHREGRQRLERVLGKAAQLEKGAPPASLVQAQALVVAGHLAYRQSDFDIARAYYEAGRFQLEQLDAQQDVGQVLHNLGLLHHKQGKFTEAKSLYASSLAKLRMVEDKVGMANVLNSLGNLAWMQADTNSARNYYLQSTNHWRDLGNKHHEALVVNNLGAIAMSDGDYAAAEQIFQRCLTIQRELTNKNGISLALSNLAEVAVEQNDIEGADIYLEEAFKLKDELGHREGIAILMETAGRLELTRGQLSRSATLFGASEQLREQLQAPRPDIVQNLCEEAWTQVRAKMGQEAFAISWATGRSLTEPDMLAYALGDSSEN